MEMEEKRSERGCSSAVQRAARQRRVEERKRRVAGSEEMGSDDSLRELLLACPSVCLHPDAPCRFGPSAASVLRGAWAAASPSVPGASDGRVCRPSTPAALHWMPSITHTLPSSSRALIGSLCSILICVAWAIDGRLMAET